MTKLKTWLSVLLALQVVLVVVFFVGGNRGADFDQEQPLIAVDTNTLDKIVIVDNEGSTINFVKDGDNWRLPDYGDLPANTAKVDEIVEKIEQAKTAWPIAESASSRERFEVSDENFQRKITLFKNGEVASTFYLGTSPGYRSVHLRREGEDAVYSVKLATHDFITDEESWFDRRLLAVKSVDKISFSDFALVKNEDTWQLASSPSEDENQALDQDEVKELVSLFTGLSAQAYVENVELSDVTKVQVSAEEGSFEYSFAAVDGDFYAKRGDMEKVFRISQYDYDKLKDLDLANLVKPETEDDQAELNTDASNNAEVSPSSQTADAIQTAPLNQSSDK